MRAQINGELKDIYVKAADTYPIGGTCEIPDDMPIPDGWELAEYNNVKNLWKGTLYDDNGQITLAEPLEVGSAYVFTFLGFSGSYYQQHVVTFIDYVHGMQFTILGLDTNNVLNSARARIYASEDKKTLTLNSVNMAENTALKRIDKLC